MSRSEFDTVFNDFLKEIETSQTLAKYQSPIEARQEQTIAIGKAAVNHRLRLAVRPLISLLFVGTHPPPCFLSFGRQGRHQTGGDLHRPRLVPCAVQSRRQKGLLLPFWV